MKTALRVFLAFLCIMIAMPAGAQVGGVITRAQTRVIERAVSHNVERLFKPHLKVVQGDTGPVTAVSLSGDEHYLVSAVGDNSLRVWDLFVGREVARLQGHTGRILSVTISGDGKRLASASEDRTIRIWSLENNTQLTVLADQPAAVTGVVFSPDGERLASATADGGVSLWRLPAGTLEQRMSAHTAGPVSLVVSGDGQRLLSGGQDGRLVVWNLADGGKLSEGDVGRAILSLALSADGKLALVGTTRGLIRLWDLDSATLLSSQDAHDGGVSGLTLDAVGKTVISGGADGAVRRWTLADGKLTLQSELGKHDRPVTFLVLSKDGALSLSASEDGTTRLWNLTSGSQLVTLLSTETGWAVVDSQGRYEGNQESLWGIEWQAEDASLPVDNFAEGYYEPSLLIRQIKGDPDLGEVKSIGDGVHYPPKVVFVNPTASGPTEERRVVVEVTAEEDGGGGVSEVRLYRNGKVVPAVDDAVRQETTEQGGKRLVGRYEVDLTPGTTTLSATALNDEKLESNPRVINLKNPQLPSPGAFHVLAVGINHYRNETYNLQLAKPDATAIAAYFQRIGGPGKVVDVRTLFDEQATKANILAALRDLRQVPMGDTVVIYFAGHGVSLKNDWYFIPHDLERPNMAADLRVGGLSSADIKTEMEALTAERTLLLLDACQSGTVVDPLRDYRGMKSIRLMARAVGTHVLAATDHKQSAYEEESLGHGIYTYALLNILTGSNGAQLKDGVVTAEGAIRYVEHQVPLLSQQYVNEAQYPTGYSRGVDFEIARLGQ